MTEEQDVHVAELSLEEKGLAVTHYDLLTEHEKELLELEARINAGLDAKIAANPTKMPKAVYFILPNEFGERFCYYAVQPNLNKYFILVTGMNAADAKIYSTAFNMLSYFFPLVGAALSDSFLGKWWTIILFSCIYVVGMIMITVFAIPNLLGPVGTVSHFLTFLPMLIIALGTGGVKPCVSSHGGDQYLASQEVGKDFFFNAFYVAINSGALITRYVVPEISKRGCYGQDTCFAGAFLLPTIVFILGLVIFASGRRFYRIVPPVGEFLPLKAVKATFHAAKGYFAASPSERKAKGHWLNFSEEKYGGVFVEEVRDFGLVLVPIVIPFSFCWMLFNQNSNEWADQYYLMSGALFGGKDPNRSYVQSAQFSIINTILLVIFVPTLPFFYQFCARHGLNFSPGRRLTFGFFCAIISFIISAILSPKIRGAYNYSPYRNIEPATRDGMYCAECYSGWWQFPQWFFLSFGEAFFAPTGVQFMYIESGRQFRAVAISFWMLAVSFGSILILIFDPVFDAKLTAGAKSLAFSGLGFFGFILCVISMHFYTPRKIRPSINESARVAKEAEYALLQ
ncbi:hypothetical protein BGZ54_003360 [Gamsiella multidivaricata]|nr:hypothetical protein BGZ54_003360 [Gamsiella multidivaricata]